MFDVFISYKREDRRIADRLGDALRAARLSVFDDSGLLGGAQFVNELEAQIRQAACVIVVWTAQSVRSDWVLGEAGLAHQQGKLIPLRVEDVEPPLPYRHIHTMEVDHWLSGSDPGFVAKLLESVRHHLDVRRRQAPLAGLVLGGWRLTELLGSGGMATVYRAVRDSDGEEDAAMKILRPDLASDPSFIERLRREAVIVNEIDSPHVIRYGSLFEDDGYLCLLMEHLHGYDFARMAALSARCSVDTLVEYALQATEGLAAAHDRRVVHRDIKPENLFLDTAHDRVVVLDFGVSTAAQFTSRLTRASMTGRGGSLAFLAPEAVESGQMDERTDVYALGFTLWELFAGHHPFADPMTGRLPPEAAVMRKHATETVPEVRNVRADVSPAVSAVLDRAMAIEPHRRWSSAREMYNALQYAVACPDDGTLDRTRRRQWGRSHDQSTSVSMGMWAAFRYAAGCGVLALGSGCTLALAVSMIGSFIGIGRTPVDRRAGQPPPVVSASAHPPIVEAGETTMLQWEASNAEECEVVGVVSGLGKAGRVPVLIETSGSLDVRCWRGELSATETVHVRTKTKESVATRPGQPAVMSTTSTPVRRPVPAPWLRLVVDPSRLEVGDVVNVEWEVTHAESCRLSTGTGDSNVVPVRGTRSVRIDRVGVIDLVLTCQNEDHVEEIATARVEGIAALRILDFVASPESITRGESTRIRWSTVGASSCSLEGESVALDGERSVSPSLPQTYTLRCDSPTGRVVEQTATVWVEEPAPPCKIHSFRAEDRSIEKGDSTWLQWRVSNDYELYLQGDPVYGDMEMVEPRSTTTYVLECVGLDGSTVRSADVTIEVEQKSLSVFGTHCCDPYGRRVCVLNMGPPVQLGAVCVCYGLSGSGRACR